MFRFACFYVPPAESALYRLGSELLGYDLRAGRARLLSPELRAALGDWPEAWRRKARPFGFHLTVGEALEGDPGDLLAILESCAELLACLDPASALSLEFLGLERWEDDRVWALHYRASPALQVLQALIVARLSAFGKHSAFVDEVAQDPRKYPAPHERRRLELFLSPRGLDSWQAHFTLLNPYGGAASTALERELRALFSGFARLEVASLCLVSQEDDAPWRVAGELARPG